MQRNVLEYIENTVERVPNKIAFADERTQLTFCEFYDDIIAKVERANPVTLLQSVPGIMAFPRTKNGDVSPFICGTQERSNICLMMTYKNFQRQR